MLRTFFSVAFFSTYSSIFNNIKSCLNFGWSNRSFNRQEKVQHRLPSIWKRPETATVNFGRVPLLSWIKNVTKTKPCKETLITRFQFSVVLLFCCKSSPIQLTDRETIFLIFYRLRFRRSHIESESKCRCYLPRVRLGLSPTLIMLMEANLKTIPWYLLII